jgi:hypothetical protein
MSVNVLPTKYLRHTPQGSLSCRKVVRRGPTDLRTLRRSDTDFYRRYRSVVVGWI